MAVEFRHPSWHCEDVYRLLETHRAAYCVLSGAQLPCVLQAGGPDVFVYFNNDGQANAVRNARTLRCMLGQ